jgi:hypothetical protein
VDGPDLDQLEETIGKSLKTGLEALRCGKRKGNPEEAVRRAYEEMFPASSETPTSQR